MASLLAIFGIALALLAVPAGVRARRLYREGRAERGARESLRCGLALGGAIALVLIAMGRSA